MRSVLLVGNPNCGKTSVFNALTGSHQRVGNWPGVTVEKKTGEFVYQCATVMVTDLPGVYSLAVQANELSQDEQIAAQALTSLDADCLINVVDACHLERHLYLTSQLLELGKPLILALNMIDLAKARGIQIDIHALSKQLGCPVIPIQAHRQIGLDDLKEAVLAPLKPGKAIGLSLSSEVVQGLAQLETQLLQRGYNPLTAFYCSRRLAEGDVLHLEPQLTRDLPQDLDILLADARYQKIHEIVRAVQHKKSDASEYFTAKLDRIVLHRFFALPLFFAMMYLMFVFAINIGGAFQDFFDISTNTLFVQGSAHLLTLWHAPAWLIALLANGVGKGINTTLTFIPVIAAMFFFLSFLETSGYMTRAAFVVDKAMRALGLPGKTFVPMIIGFGCNVPAIMAARTLDSERDRLLTVMMSPFMSCSARLAIYAVFVAAFFPKGGQNVVFSLYLIGILMAVLTGFLLRKTRFKGQPAALILELPAYHRPSLKRLFKETSMRLRFFVLRAGKWILPICVILGGLNALTLGGGLSTSEASTQSLLSFIGREISFLFAPMGIHQDNWPATVGLLTGMLAKEVVIGSLNSLYVQLGHLNELGVHDYQFWAGMKAAVHSIPENLSQLASTLWSPFAATHADNKLSQSVYGMMAARFDGQIGAYAYLLFVLLYIPCVSTMAVIRQEASKQLMWISVIWSLAVAYAAAVIFYQAATWWAHPQQSIGWIAMMCLGLGGLLSGFYYSGALQPRLQDPSCV